MAIKSRTEVNGKIAIVEVKGALVGDNDTDAFREVVADFIEQGNRSLVIDLAKVNYLNSSGLGALISAHTSYGKNGGTIKLSGLTNNVQNLLIMTKLIDVFDVYDTVDEAIDNILKIHTSK